VKTFPKLYPMDRRTLLSLVLVAVGFFLIGYVASQYYSMYHEQQRLARLWEQQNSTPNPAAKMTASDGLTRLVIPKIDLDAIVVEGTSSHQLKIGPGHILNTALPGESGNAVISAHRDTFFRHIYELSKGDEILVRRNGTLLRYVVTGKKIVDPEDLSVLHQTKDPELTLITCYPTYYIGPAPERLVVFSKLADRKADVSLFAERKAAAASASSASQ
jgi:sortase A